MEDGQIITPRKVNMNIECGCGDCLKHENNQEPENYTGQDWTLKFIPSITVHRFQVTMVFLNFLE